MQGDEQDQNQTVCGGLTNFWWESKKEGVFSMMTNKNRDGLVFCIGSIILNYLGKLISILRDGLTNQDKEFGHPCSHPTLDLPAH